MRPQKVYLIVLAVILAFCLVYFRSHSQGVISEERIKLAIEHENAGISNLKIKRIEEFKGNPLVLYSYDFLDGHYIACRHFDDNHRLSGGSGAHKVDRNQPLSIISFGCSEPEKYTITYGEIYNHNISSIEIKYNDGKRKVVKPENGTFIVISDNSPHEFTGIKAYDIQGKVLYHSP